MGRVVSQLEAPFSLASSFVFLREFGNVSKTRCKLTLFLLVYFALDLWELCHSFGGTLDCCRTNLTSGAVTLTDVWQPPEPGCLDQDPLSYMRTYVPMPPAPETTQGPMASNWLKVKSTESLFSFSFLLYFLCINFLPTVMWCTVALYSVFVLEFWSDEKKKTYVIWSAYVCGTYHSQCACASNGSRELHHSCYIYQWKRIKHWDGAQKWLWVSMNILIRTVNT